MSKPTEQFWWNYYLPNHNKQ